MTEHKENKESTSIYSVVVFHDFSFLAIRDTKYRKWIKMDFQDWDNHAIDLFSSTAESGVSPWDFERSGYNSLEDIIAKFRQVYLLGHKDPSDDDE